MKKLTFLLMIAVLISACNQQAGKEKESTETKVDAAMSVDDVLASADSYIDKVITVKGMVTHVCKHGGQKLFVAGNEEGIALRINTSDDIAEFSIDLEGSEAEFTGVLKLMTEEFKAEAEAEHMEHHGEEAEAEEGKAHPDDTAGEKSYFIVATTFKTL